MSRGPAERSPDNRHFSGTNPKWLCSLALLAVITAGARAEIPSPAPSSCLCFPREELKDFLIRIQEKKKHYQFFKSLFLLNCQLSVISLQSLKK